MITLPAICYDKLALSVGTHGLGAGRYYRFDPARHVPVPLDFIAHFETCFGDGGDGCHRYGITTAMADKAVYAINKRLHRPLNERVTWQAFAQELDIRRCDLSAHESSIEREPEREVSDVKRMEERAMEG